ncbi:hypothetical protein HIM_06450 [Hirsutella minnesotensis 3608]|uniref:LPXTG-domain-containing protein n=1 Tax=Hirsutella minnesotensis 3608 TaxID=1043627 RepID=A0A0F8A4V1_9HYPO|nr:hypothetical protein HIM_06450 [Hirsutella minnesotensis 3608]
MKPGLALVPFPWFTFQRLTTALQVTPGSFCAAYCLDSSEGNDFLASDSNTKVAEIACNDADYLKTDRGIKFRECVDCLQTSTKFAEGESDLKWYIYNLRYAFTSCLFSVPAAPPNRTLESPCNADKACRPLKAALVNDSLQPSPQTTFDYCHAAKGAFSISNLTPCISCLRSTDGEVYLSNFMVALEAACAQTPADGQILGLNSSLFTTDAVSTIASPGSGMNQSNRSLNLSSGAIAGIVIGVVLIFVLAAGLFTFHWRREDAFDHEDHEWDAVEEYAPYPHHPNHCATVSATHDSTNKPSAFFGRPRRLFASATGYHYHEKDEDTDSKPTAVPHSSVSNSTIPTHPAYIPPGGTSTTDRPHMATVPSPPAVAHRPERSNTPDSFAVQAYLDAAEHSARLATTPASNFVDDRLQTGRKSRWPFALLSPFRLFRKSVPSGPAVEARTPMGRDEGVEMQISAPMATKQRKKNRPIPRPILVPIGPTAKKHKGGRRGNGFIEVPLGSGKSTLYGM